MLDLTNHVYGRLTVRKFSHHATSNYHGYSHKWWVCDCECGETTLANTRDLRRYHKLSCGCLRRETSAALGKTHFLGVGVHLTNALFGRYKGQARRRNYVWELDREQFVNLISNNCFYCGAEPNNGTDELKYNGIDRVDNSKGYTSSNTVTCCKVCNLAKHAMAVDDFYIWVARVYHKLYTRRVD